MSHMSNSVNKGSSEIDESGFDIESNRPDKKVTALNQKNSATTINDSSSSHGRTSRGAGMLSAKMGGMVLAGIIGTGALYWAFTPPTGSDHETPIAQETVAANEKMVEVAPEKPASVIGNFSVGQGPDGVSINGHHDLIATMLLQNYPTREELRQEIVRVRGADVSKEELNAFLLGVKNNADDIRQIKSQPGTSVDTAEIRSAIRDIRSMVEQIRNDSEEQNIRIGMMQDDLEKLKKNAGWYHNRISKLEGNPAKTTQIAKTKANPTSEARRVEMKAQSAWSVNGASEDLAFIQNVHSGKRLRVTRGFDIPGCGQVTDISPADQKVTTTTCVISN